MKRLGFGFFLLALYSTSAIARDPGLWPTFMIDKIANPLVELGYRLPVKDLMDPTAFPLNAVIQLGNPQHMCSASFVSSEGLVVTNHHCIEGFLLSNSKLPEVDLNKNGFYAKTLADEIPASATARLYVTQSFKDVSALVLTGIDQISDPAERYKAIQAKQAAALASCKESVKATTDIECEVANFYEGGQFFEIRKKVIRDVRLVYAPEAQIGFYGGFDDNWRWPRHTGDFGFLRAYVGPDGESKTFDAANVPYKPKSYLKFADQGIVESDLVLVAGYPGRTSNLATAFEAKEAADWLFPWTVKHYRGLIAAMEGATNDRPEAKQKITSTIFSLMNSMQNREGSVPNMISSHLIGDKMQAEAEMRAWLREKDSEGKKYGNVLERLERIQSARVETRTRDQLFNELTRDIFSSELIGFARRALADSTAPSTSDKGKEFAKYLESFYKNFDPILDRAKFEFQMKRLQATPERDWPASFATLNKLAEASSESLSTYLYERTLLSNLELAKALLQQGNAYQVSNDPFIRLAKAVDKEAVEVSARASAYNGEMAILRSLYVQALRDFSGAKIFPDANSTLRISYGQVMGYSTKNPATQEVIQYTPFTTFSEMIARDKPNTVFEVPQQMRDIFKQDAYSGFALGFKNAQGNPDLPVNFLSNSHITGGNSGSATLNNRGEIVGLAFDSTYEGLGSDWRFVPETTRTIHVDSRYIHFVMMQVDKTDRLLDEMSDVRTKNAELAPGVSSPE